MAVEVGSAYVSVLPSFRGFGRATARELNAELGDVGRSAGQKVGRNFSAGLNQAGKSVSGFGRNLTLGLSAPLAAFGAQSFKTFAEFDKTMRQVGVQTGQSGKQLEGMSNLALKMGKDTSFSAKQAADAMLELAKGGLNEAQIRGGALQNTLTLAAAGGVELGEAAGYVANAMSAFGLSASKTSDITTALAGGANASTASVQSLGQGLAQSSAQARQAGLDLNDTVGVLALFDQYGVKGSDAGTSLKTMLQRLTPTTDAARKAMQQYGLSFTDSEGNFRSMGDIAQQLQTRLGGLSESQRSAALNTIFGSDASRAASILMDAGRAGVEKFTKATKDRSQAEKLAKANTSGASGAMEQFGGAVETLQITLAKRMAPAVTGAVKDLTGLVNKFSELSPATQDFILKASAAGIVAGPAFIAIGGAMRGISSTITGVTKAGTATVTAGRAAAGAAGRFRDGFMNSAAAASRFSGIAGTAGGIARKAFSGLQVAASVAGKGVLLLGRAFATAGAFMLANPIVLIVTAIVALGVALFVAYKKSETFRNIVNSALNSVAAAGKWLWTTILQPALNGIVAGFRAVGAAVSWVWSTILKPVFNFFKAAAQILFLVVATVLVTAFKFWASVVSAVWNGTIKPVFSAVGRLALWLWNSAIRPAFGFIRAAFGVLGNVAKVVFAGIKLQIRLAGAVFRWLYNNVVKPVFNGISAVLRWIWRTVIVGTFNGIKSAIRALAAVFRWLNTNVVKPVFNAISAAIKWAWNNVIKPQFNALKSGINSVGSFFRWLRDKVVVPVWNRIHGAIKSGWDKINGLFGLLKKGLGKVGEFFVKTRDGIVTSWNKIKNAVRKPIVAVVDTVINRGLINTWNTIAGKVGLKKYKLGKLKVPAFAEGGRIRGAGSGTSDSILARLSDEEFVVRAKQAKRHPRLLEAINRGQLDYDLPRFAKGGRVYPTYSRNANTYPGHRRAGAVDFPVPSGTRVGATEGGQVTRVRTLTGSYGRHMIVGHRGGWETLYAHLSRFVARAGQDVVANSHIANSGNTGNSTGPHLHFEAHKNGRSVSALGYLRGAAAGSGGIFGGIAEFIAGAWKKAKTAGEWAKNSVGQAVTDLKDNAVGLIKKFVGEPVKALLKKAGLGRTAGQFGHLAAGVPPKLVGYLGEAATNLAKKLKDPSGSSGLDGGTPGKNQAIARALLGNYGWGGGEWPALKRLWIKESGWNHKATNPSSGAYGIPQSLPGSKMRSAGADWRSNPETQIKWGLGYIRDRYGSPSRALSFHLGHNWYDSGGWMPAGSSVAVNGTRKPEAVLTARQWDAMESLARQGAEPPQVRVFIGDRELTDLVRVQVHDYDHRVARATRLGRRP